MLGYLFRPRWSLDLWKPKDRIHYALECRSAGFIVGYIATDLERGKRPAQGWIVSLVHKSGQKVQITRDWPTSESPVQQVLNKVGEIDPKHMRKRGKASFWDLCNFPRRELPIVSSLDGVPITELPISRRIELAQLGLDSDATVGVHDVIAQAFTFDFGTHDPFRGQPAYIRY